jgi:hypothetical protein
MVESIITSKAMFESVITSKAMGGIEHYRNRVLINVMWQKIKTGTL